MPRLRQAVVRFWSLAAACLFPMLLFRMSDAAFSVMEHSDPVEQVWAYCALAASSTLLCVGLLWLSWRQQRRWARNRWRRAFWLSFLVFPGLATVFFGLRNIQLATYDFAHEFDRFTALHIDAMVLKEGLAFWVAPLDLLLILIFAVAALVAQCPAEPKKIPPPEVKTSRRRTSLYEKTTSS